MGKESVLPSCLPRLFIFIWKHILTYLPVQYMTGLFFLKENIRGETVMKREILGEDFGRAYMPHGAGIFTCFLPVCSPSRLNGK